MATIAFLGTGLLGSGFVEAARSRGDTVHVWNRTASKAKALERFGANACEQIDQAVRGVERVHMVLAEDNAVDSVLEKVIPAIGKDTVIVDHTTASPRGTAARSERLGSKGVAFLHAPVFMSPDNARAAKGMMLVSGSEAVLNRVKPALDAMTGEVWYMGERPDKAAAFKLFGNAMLITIAGGLADVLSIARGVGIEPTEAIGLFSKFKAGGAIDVRGARMARGDFAASFESTMARKDVRLMIEAAGDLPLSVLPGIAARMDTLIAKGHGRDDLGVLAIDALQVANKK